MTIRKTEENLLEALCIGICERLFTIEEKFWAELHYLEKEQESEDLKEWLVKLIVHLEREVERTIRRKRKKLKKLCTDEMSKQLVDERFLEHSNLFTFFAELKNFCDDFSPDILNLVNLLTLAPSSVDISKASNISANSEILSNESPNLSPSNKLNRSSNNCPLEKEVQLNSATIRNNRYEGKFVSANVINLSSCYLSKDEVSVLSKGLQFVPTPKHINKAKIKEEIEVYGRKLRLMWHFRNDHQEFDVNPFKKKSKFNPKGDAAIEMYLSRLEEEILSLDGKISYSNLTKGERNALYLLCDDPSIIIKEADKRSAVVVWDREDYLREANSQLIDKDVYREVKGYAEDHLIKVIKSVLRKIRNRGDVSDETLDYFLVNNPKLGRFDLLPKIHKRLHNVPGRPVISNSGYYTENISSSLDFHLKPLAQKVKSYIQDTNDFLKKIANLPPLPDDRILCTIDVVGLYPNIPHEEGLIAIRKALDTRKDKTILTDSLIELAECVLKNNIFEHNKSVFKQLRGTE